MDTLAETLLYQRHTLPETLFYQRQLKASYIQVIPNQRISQRIAEYYVCTKIDDIYLLIINVIISNKCWNGKIQKGLVCKNLFLGPLPYLKDREDIPEADKWWFSSRKGIFFDAGRDVLWWCSSKEKGAYSNSGALPKQSHGPGLWEPHECLHFLSFADSFSHKRCSTGNLPAGCRKSQDSYLVKLAMRRRGWFSPATWSPAPCSSSWSSLLSPASSSSWLESARSSSAPQPGFPSGSCSLDFSFLPSWDYSPTLRTLFNHESPPVL